MQNGGAGGTRTPYLFNAIEALSQLSYSPIAALPGSSGTNIAKPTAGCTPLAMIFVYVLQSEKNGRYHLDARSI